MIDEDMQKELEEFRNNNTRLSKISTGSCDDYKRDSGVLAEAIMNLGSTIQKSTQGIDNVLNPFKGASSKNLAKGNSKEGDKKKDISKFLPSKGAKTGSKFSNFQKDTGFSLSNFWKKN